MMREEYIQGLCPQLRAALETGLFRPNETGRLMQLQILRLSDGTRCGVPVGRGFYIFSFSNQEEVVRVEYQKAAITEAFTHLRFLVPEQKLCGELISQDAEDSQEYIVQWTLEDGPPEELAEIIKCLESIES